MVWNADGLHFGKQRKAIQSISPSLTLLYVIQIKKLQTFAIQTTESMKEEWKINSPLVGCPPRIIDVAGEKTAALS